MWVCGCGWGVDGVWMGGDVVLGCVVLWCGCGCGCMFCVFVCLMCVLFLWGDGVKDYGRGSMPRTFSMGVILGAVLCVGGRRGAGGAQTARHTRYY